MKVGEYIRTPYGIRKIVGIEKDECYKPRVKILVFDKYIEDVHHFGYKFYTDEKIIKNSKHSFNIIDLIEVGDYVNGERVNYIDECKGAMREFYYMFEEVTHDVGHYEEEIKSIVTKECFESMEYKVGE